MTESLEILSSAGAVYILLSLGMYLLVRLYQVLPGSLQLLDVMHNAIETTRLFVPVFAVAWVVFELLT